MAEMPRKRTPVEVAGGAVKDAASGTVRLESDRKLPFLQASVLPIGRPASSLAPAPTMRPVGEHGVTDSWGAGRRRHFQCASFEFSSMVC